MIQLTDHVKSRFRLDVASKAIAAEAIDDIGKAPVANTAAICGHVEFKKLPVTCRGVPARSVLDHDFCRNELHHLPRRVDTAIDGFCNSDGRIKVAEQIIDKEVSNRLHVVETSE